MKQLSPNRITLLLTLALLAFALPTWAQDKSKSTAVDKKEQAKQKQTASSKEKGKPQPTLPPSTSSQKEVIHPTGQTVPPTKENPVENQTGNSIAVNKENFDKAVTLEIHEIVKEDAKAKPSGNLHERIVPVVVKWKGKSVNQGKLVALEVLLETVNTDGAKSHVSKKIVDLAVDKLLAETILLPMKEGIFARDFKLTLSGKCASGEGANRKEVAISTSKQGSFPVPSLVEKQ